MRTLQITLSLLTLIFLTASARTLLFEQAGSDYRFELPSDMWQAVARPLSGDQADFIYAGDQSRGYLRLRKRFVESGTTAVDLFSRDEKWSLQSLPGYVICGECKGINFEGHLLGRSFSYVYIEGGKQMAGRIYYLQVDDRTVYSLHFTVAREKLPDLHNQMEAIARSFRMK